MRLRSKPLALGLIVEEQRLRSRAAIMRRIRCRSKVVGPAKHLFQRSAKCAGNAEGHFQRRRIFTLLYGCDCLAGNADGIAQIALRHFARKEAQRFDVVAKGKAGHSSIAPPVEIELGADPNKL